MQQVISFKNELDQLVRSYEGILTNVEIIGVLQLESAAISYDSLTIEVDNEE